MHTFICIPGSHFSPGRISSNGINVTTSIPRLSPTTLSVFLITVAFTTSPSFSLKYSYARFPPNSFNPWMKICLKRVAPFLPICENFTSCLNSEPTLTLARNSFASSRVICPSGPSGSTSSTTMKFSKIRTFFCSSLNSTSIAPLQPSS